MDGRDGEGIPWRTGRGAPQLPLPERRCGAPVPGRAGGTAEDTPSWTERKARAAKRRATGLAVADRKRAETEELASSLARELAAGLLLPTEPQQAAIASYNDWHSSECTCPGVWHEGFCDKRASAKDSPDFLRRITINYVRHELTGYDNAYSQLARRAGRQEAHELLRAKVNAAIAAKLNSLEEAASARAPK